MTDAMSHDYRLEVKRQLIKDFEEYIWKHHIGYPSPEGFVKHYNAKEKEMEKEIENLRKENEKRGSL